MRISLAVILAIVTLSSTTVAQERKPGDITYGRVFSDEEAKSAESFWTDENLKNAQPLPFPQISPEERQPLPPEFDKRSKLQQLRSRTDNLQSNLEQIVSSARRADSTKPPYKFAGKLFFTKQDGTRHWCTAETVGDRSVILTAAHCIIDRGSGTLNSNFEFREGYSGGGGVRRTADCVLTNPNWLGAVGQWARTQYDYAFMKMRQLSSGQIALKVNWTYSYAASIGYPAAIDNGEFLQVVSGPIGKVPLPVQVYGMKVFDTMFSAGVSGGAWLGDLQEGSSAGNYAISVNSAYYIDPIESGVIWLYGPYFDPSTSDLFRRVRQGCR